MGFDLCVIPCRLHGGGFYCNDVAKININKCCIVSNSGIYLLCQSETNTIKPKTMHPSFDIDQIDYTNPVLDRIYSDAVSKFIKQPEGNIKFEAIRDYCKRKLLHRKQCLYTHALPLIKSVCAAVAEPFEDACEYACPDAVNYRDLYFSIIH